MDSHHTSHLSHTGRSFKGCWTCRLRRKKCDERQPVCEACSSLYITCHYDQINKPDWMDGGVKQEAMAEQVKREVKEKAHLRRGERAATSQADHIPSTEPASTISSALQQTRPKCLGYPVSTDSNAQSNEKSAAEERRNSSLDQEDEYTLLMKDAREHIVLGEADTILLMFYIDSVLPFQFPFYRPSILEGGKAWVLEMLLRSPVIQKSALCQSSYFFSLARGAAVSDGLWSTILCQATDAFEMLRKALQVLDCKNVAAHLHGAVRIFASIMQVQRFEIAVLSFDNCQSHLSAALILFRQLLECVGPIEKADCTPNFKAVLSLLGPFSPISSTENIQIPGAEHVAFRFSSRLLVLDDIIASTFLQEQPQLYDLHGSLLGRDNASPLIDLESVIGCQNWVLLAIGEIATLDAWKQESKRVGNLNVMELVQRATAIKTSLETQLAHLQNSPVNDRTEHKSILDAFAAEQDRSLNGFANQSSLVTSIWAHAAMVYLFVAVSGWQPASAEVRYHVSRIIDLLMHHLSSPALLRTMVWPFCVAGCLAEGSQEASLRSMVEALQPQRVFGTLMKALEIMENVWRHRNTGDIANQDLSACFRSQGDRLVLLV